MQPHFWQLLMPPSCLQPAQSSLPHPPDAVGLGLANIFSNVSPPFSNTLNLIFGSESAISCSIMHQVLLALWLVHSIHLLWSSSFSSPFSPFSSKVSCSPWVCSEVRLQCHCHGSSCPRCSQHAWPHSSYIVHNNQLHTIFHSSLSIQEQHVDPSLAL